MFKCQGSVFEVCWAGNVCHLTQRFDGGVKQVEVPVTHVSRLIKELADAALECAAAGGKDPEETKS